MDPANRVAVDFLDMIVHTHRLFDEAAVRLEVQRLEDVLAEAFPVPGDPADTPSAYEFTLNLTLPEDFFILSFFIGFHFDGESWVIERGALWLGGEIGWPQFDLAPFARAPQRVDSAADLRKELPYIAQTTLKPFCDAVIAYLQAKKK